MEHTATLTCTTCGSTFLLTDAEREFREARSMAQPTLCLRCRAVDRQNRAAETVALHRWGAEAEATHETSTSVAAAHERTHLGKRQTAAHHVKCSVCGRPTTVPFVPSPGRPVYCRECLKRRGR